MTETGEVPQDFLQLAQARVDASNATLPAGGQKFMLDVHGNEQALTLKNQIVKVLSGKTLGVPNAAIGAGILALLGYWLYKRKKKRGRRR